MHLFVTLIYVGVILVGIAGTVITKENSVAVSIVIPASVLGLCSISLWGACLDQGVSMGQARMLIQAILGSMCVIFFGVVGFASLMNIDGRICAFIAVLWILVVVMDCVIAKIYWDHAIYEATGHPIWNPPIPDILQCTSAEDDLYIVWSTLSGFLALIFTIVLIVEDKFYQNQELGNGVSWCTGACMIAFLLSVSFMGACRQSGRTQFEAYGYSVLSIMGVYVFIMLYHHYLQKKNNTFHAINVTAGPVKVSVSADVMAFIFSGLLTLMIGYSSYLVYMSITENM